MYYMLKRKSCFSFIMCCHVRVRSTRSCNNCHGNTHQHQHHTYPERLDRSLLGPCLANGDTNHMRLQIHHSCMWDYKCRQTSKTSHFHIVLLVHQSAQIAILLKVGLIRVTDERAVVCSDTQPVAIKVRSANADGTRYQPTCDEAVHKQTCNGNINTMCTTISSRSARYLVHLCIHSRAL